MGDIDRYFDWFEPALDYFRYTYTRDELAADIGSGECLIVRVFLDGEPTAAALLRGVDTAEGRELLVMAIVGEQTELWQTQLDEVFVGLAENFKASWLTVEGRQGWQRRLAPFGYTIHSVVMRKPIRGKTNGQ
jgi:hypothetical protein